MTVRTKRKTRTAPASASLPKGFMSEQQAAEYLMCSQSLLRTYRSRRNRGITGVELGPLFYENGHRVAYQQSDLKEWRDRNKSPERWTKKGENPKGVA
jgi:hypothetical protein